MLSRGRPFARLILLCVAVTLTLAAAPLPATAPLGPSSVPVGALAHFRPEVRLRKLHLVRPDLIPYPIAYEVYC